MGLDVHHYHVLTLIRAERKCWGLDGFEAGAWASPYIGQHKLYIPSYFLVENNVRSRSPNTFSFFFYYRC